MITPLRHTQEHDTSEGNTDCLYSWYVYIFFFCVFNILLIVLSQAWIILNARTSDTSCGLGVCSKVSISLSVRNHSNGFEWLKRHSEPLKRPHMTSGFRNNYARMPKDTRKNSAPYFVFQETLHRIRVPPPHSYYAFQETLPSPRNRLGPTEDHISSS